MTSLAAAMGPKYRLTSLPYDLAVARHFEEAAEAPSLIRVLPLADVERWKYVG